MADPHEQDPAIPVLQAQVATLQAQVKGLLTALGDSQGNVRNLCWTLENLITDPKKVETLKKWRESCL